MSYTVYFGSGATAWVKGVEADDPDDAIEKAYGEVHASLCHQCAHEVDLGGDWEPEAVYDDETNELVWEERPLRRI